MVQKKTKNQFSVFHLETERVLLVTSMQKFFRDASSCVFTTLNFIQSAASFVTDDNFTKFLYLPVEVYKKLYTFT